MLLAALIFFVFLCFMLGFFLRYAAAEINRLETRLTSSEAEAEHWIFNYSAAAARNDLAAEALKSIEAMRTDGMANIGVRMSKAASDGLNAMYPTVIR